MKKTLFMAFALLLAFVYKTDAQSKVFKEVSEEISSTTEPITQDGALVGYLVFTQLEKASEDSFNYKITIMDENLNDIGTVDFKEIGLNLQAVSFEQDVLCLAYLKSSIMGKTFSGKKAGLKEYQNAADNNKAYIFTQFISLDGKIIKQNNTPAAVTVKEEGGGYTTGAFGSWKTQNRYGSVQLSKSIELKNIAQQGFACFYGDNNGRKLIVFNSKGDQQWEKKTDGDCFSLLATTDYVYLLAAKNTTYYSSNFIFSRGVYSLYGYGVKDSSSYPVYHLEDKEGNGLNIFSFNTDPITLKPYLAGYIIDPKKGKKFFTAMQRSRGSYAGLFTVNINSPKKSDIKETYSYWNDGGLNPDITKKGYFSEYKSYANFASSIRDFNGNTYFIGSQYHLRPKWGSIGFSALLVESVIAPALIIGIGGTSKFKITDALVVKQDAKGVLTAQSSVPCDHTSFQMAKMPIEMKDNKSFYSVTNSDTKTNYLIVDDTKNTVIYNVSQNKVVKTIPHKEGKVTTNIAPAKEGHIMIIEYNKKEKYTRLSIEAL